MTRLRIGLLGSLGEESYSPEVVLDTIAKLPPAEAEWTVDKVSWSCPPRWNGEAPCLVFNTVTIERMVEDFFAEEDAWRWDERKSTGRTRFTLVTKTENQRDAYALA